MSVDNEDQNYRHNASGNVEAVLKDPKLSYTREFLLSLSNLDVCRRLPSGFDESLLSEFDGTSQSIPDRPRIPGSLPLQSLRRSQYGSSPPTQGDSGNYSRGIHGKWESRSSGKSERDNDSQSDRDSESGRRLGNQARGSWQTREHDGLLGSGSFPRPFGNASGMSAPKTRTNEHYQLSKSNEPYHPPRPYKALPHSRRDTDSYNDETFGSMECTSEDRAEEERKRRASFEIMRKEQQKVLQEKQKSNLENQKDGMSDLCEDLDDSKEEKGHFASHSSRPLVPPGFRNNVLDNNSGVKSLIHPPLSEVRKPVTGVILSDPGANLVQNNRKDGLEQQLSLEIDLVDGQPAEKIKHPDLLNKDDTRNLLTGLDVSAPLLGMKDHISRSSSHLNFHGTLDDFGIVELDVNKVSEDTVSESNQNYSTSALENFFCSTLSMNSGGSTSAERHDGRHDDTWVPDSVPSSKFAQWFFDEVKSVDTSSGRPNDLLSLIVSGDKGRCQISDSEAVELFPPDFSSKTSEQSDQFKLDIVSTDNGVANQLGINNDEETIPAVLTCEDLEQSILSEYSGKSKAGLSVSKGWSSSGANTEQQNVHVDGHASIHLLSLLQKGTEQSVNSGVDINLGDKTSGSQECNVETTANIPKWEEDNSNVPSSVNTLTLETLFGTAFMKELQSVEAPVSVKRVSIGSAQIDTPDPPRLPFPVSDNGLSSPRRNEFGLQRPSQDYGILASNHKQQAKPSKAGNWNGFDGSLTDVTSSKHHTEAAPMHIGFQEDAETQLPDLSSISSSDPHDQWISRFMSIGSSSNNVNSSLDGHVDIMDKLASFSSVKDQQLMGGSEKRHFVRDPYESMESHIPYRNLQMQQSLPQFQTPQMSQVRPLYHQLESHPAHMNPQMKLRGTETMFNHDSVASNQIQSIMNRPSFPHHNVRVAGLEIPAHHSVLHQQIPMSGNHPPHMLPEFSRGGNQAAFFLPEMNKMQNYSFGHHVPEIGNRGVPYTDINSGGNPSEAFRRLIEMERRANSKQSHPFAPSNNRGSHGYEPDMGFQYR
ncbi:hypothetical protein F511_01279 [Dorcoceras hygrometricum]|uniref:Uncharacterized protein n=1 Tax=Dorcoceras hygrometricum TaxID=472368 RepID=A0A2Z7BS41_9LAMI|nr:hypothetical protein F511_01279 [Dorcoceras hygrometricum]